VRSESTKKVARPPNSSRNKAIPARVVESFNDHIRVHLWELLYRCFILRFDFSVVGKKPTARKL
jgi:hypothetical protein